MPLDTFNREINYLRISVIDRCNLRCPYCMPLGELPFHPREELLTPGEIGRVVQAALAAGFQRFRLTGGEPTLRRDIVEIVQEVKRAGDFELAMTTNGLLLPKLAQQLADAGLDRVNIHLDTLNEERLRQVMRFNDLKKVWTGIEAAEAAGLVPVKLNTVVVRDLNEHDVVSLASLTLEHPWHVRFIELMPLGDGECGVFSRDRYVANPRTQMRLEAALGPLSPVPNQNPWDESRNFRFSGAEGVVGFISPVSAPFCGTCNRMRLSADGKFHLCLLNNAELDVRHVLREGGGLEELRQVLVAAVIAKPVGHELTPDRHDTVRGPSNTARSMHQIGG